MKVDSWVAEIQLLAEITRCQPHAAYASCAHCVMSKWNFMWNMLTIPAIATLLQPLEEAISTKLIPAIVGHSTVSALERELISLLTHLGVLGMPNSTQLNKQISYTNTPGKLRPQWQL